MFRVVYLLTPTSNHNWKSCRYCPSLLYIFWLLHQTTTSIRLHLWTMRLYIFWLLHQTTTKVLFLLLNVGCISFDSYIKPQLASSLCRSEIVVYLLTPTSNHNKEFIKIFIKVLYIFWLLHQTTTLRTLAKESECCISFDSYIKPQHAPVTT